MRRVIIESPFAGDEKRNKVYARACIKDCFRRGEAPFASHLLYTQDGILDDNIPEERELGIKSSFAWGIMAEATVVYMDYGITSGMQKGIEQAEKEKRQIEYRKLL